MAGSLLGLEVYHIHCKVFVYSLYKGRTIIFLEGGGGMQNIEKNCLQGLTRQNKLFANIIRIKKIVCIEVRETFFLEFLNFLTKASEQHKERRLVVVSLSFTSDAFRL